VSFFHVYRSDVQTYRNTVVLISP